jgi:DNA polymerase (family 10)
MLYFTGDFDINIELRKRAKELGYILNEHGLQSLSDKKILYLSTEKEIFNFLGYKYLTPKLRSIQNLKSI